MRENPKDAIVRRLFERIDILGTISSEEDALTRIFLSKEMDTASRLLQSWMNNAGLVATVDPMQNVVGSWPSESAITPAIHLGSHYDTVINAGRYDGTLGVLLSIAALEILQLEGYQPVHHLNVLAFCDEEGIRFRSTFLGSSFICGDFDLSLLDHTDASGQSMRELLAARGLSEGTIKKTPSLIQKDDLYLEAHIEQGPQLESLDLPLGVVSGIAAQTRIQVTVIGKSGHAGTTPLNLRKDALAATSEMILAIEFLFKDRGNARATVGQIHNYPNAVNAIPGRVVFTIDLRHPVTAGLNQMRDTLKEYLGEIAENRGVFLEWKDLQSSDSIQCDRGIQSALAVAIEKHQPSITTLNSGAGHDALKVAKRCRTGMMFIRCRDGLSHHPDEYATPADIIAALHAWVDAIKELDQNFPDA